MNLRLKELMEAATIKDDRYALPDEFAEKFSELIVQECVQTLVNLGYTDASFDLYKTFRKEEK
jgi:hypothetical protein